MVRRLIFIAVLCAFTAMPALADLYQTGPVEFGPGTEGEMSLQEVFNSITQSPNLHVSGVNAATDAMLDDIDSYWSITGSGQAATTMIIELSSLATDTSFGIYDKAVSSNQVEIFAGSASPGLTGGGLKNVVIDASGAVYINYNPTGVTFAGGNNFGFYITTPSNTWFSDTDLNADQFDHMLAYQGQNEDLVQYAGLSRGLWEDNEFALAFEDQYGGGDGDWQDLVVMVESVKVPVPAAMLLGLLGLGTAGLRLRKRS